MSLMLQISNGRYSVDNSSDKALSVELQQDDTGVDKPTVPRVENQTRT